MENMNADVRVKRAKKLLTEKKHCALLLKGVLLLVVDHK